MVKESAPSYDCVPKSNVDGKIRKKPSIANLSILDDNVRGRRQLTIQQPPPSLRSASTSSLLRIKKKTPAGSGSPNDAIEMDLNTRRGSLYGVQSAMRENMQGAGENVLVDVLPSFEMYNTLHRHIPQGNVDPDRHDFPPCYQEVQVQRSSILTESEQPVERLSLDANNILLGSSGSLNNLHPLSTQHLSIHNTFSMPHDDQISIEDDVNDADNICVDKLYSLPKLLTPIDICIRVTKHALKPHEKPEEESILKEYTSGDIIHGYCVIENKSSQPLKFEMFYVTLEGCTSIVDRQKGKRTVKRFLRMVDLSASWSYSHIDVSSGVKVVPGDIDFDDAIIGLNNNRVLEPGIKYKKFFMFKLPNQLLDVTCKQEQFSHFLLPPSFGVDSFRNSCKYSGIKVNSVLGCGHLGIKGSPILTLDMADENLSINYTIDARIVGKDKKTQKLNILREHEYNLRVIPFGFSSPIIGERISSKQLKDLTALIEDELSALEKVFERLEKHEPIRSTDFYGTDISGTIDDTAELDSEEILRLKMVQLRLNNRMTTHYDLLRQKDPKSFRSEKSFVEAELSYKLKGSSNLKSGLFAGFRSSSPSRQSHKADHSNEKTHKVGLIVLTAKIPDLALPYWSPSLLRKKNKFESKNEFDQENWLRLSGSVPDELKERLEELNIQLECVQSNNSIPHDPPEIQCVTTNLICISAKSDNSIPIKLDAEMLMNKDKLSDVKKRFNEFLARIENYKQKFDKNIAELNELYNMRRTSIAPREFQFTNFISSQMLNDVESITNLETKVIKLHDVFKKQMHTLKEVPQDSISSASSGSSLNKTGSSGFLSTAFSGSSSDISRSSASTKFTEQLIHEWIKITPSKYERQVKVNLEYNQNIRETIIPSFESCLCCRFYCIRVSIKFDNHVGTASIDIPVNVKNLHT